LVRGAFLCSTSPEHIKTHNITFRISKSLFRQARGGSNGAKAKAKTMDRLIEPKEKITVKPA
jgi:hypothetical protein